MLGEQSMLPSPSPLLNSSTYFVLSLSDPPCPMLPWMSFLLASFPMMHLGHPSLSHALDNSEGAHVEGIARRL